MNEAFVEFFTAVARRSTLSSEKKKEDSEGMEKHLPTTDKIAT